MYTSVYMITYQPPPRLKSMFSELHLFRILLRWICMLRRSAKLKSKAHQQSSTDDANVMHFDKDQRSTICWNRLYEGKRCFVGLFSKMSEKVQRSFFHFIDFKKNEWKYSFKQKNKWNWRNTFKYMPKCFHHWFFRLRRLLV